MSTHTSLIVLGRIGKLLGLAPLAAALCLLCLGIAPARAALTDIATAPLANSTTAIVKPNLMFILDTSGSMSSDYMPDYVNSDSLCKRGGSSSLQTCANSDPAFASAAVNGIYYSPANTYLPAINYDGTVRTSYGSPWTAVPVDHYGQESTSTTNLTTSFPDSVWCNTGSPTTADRTWPFRSGVCKQPVAGTTWTYPDATFNQRFSLQGTSNPYFYTISSVTWCSTKDAQGFGNGTCQAKKTSTYQYPQYGTLTRTDISPVRTDVQTTVVTPVTETAQWESTSEGTGLPTAFSAAGNGSNPQTTFTCSATGTNTLIVQRVLTYNKTVVTANSGATTTTFSAVTSGPTFTVVNACSTAAKSAAATVVANGSPATTVDTITLGAATYPRAASRTDCAAAATCTYAEEMTNFANWYAYYQTRIQMMKTASGRAFANVDDKFRVGFITIYPGSPVSSSKYLPVSDFTAGAGGQKQSWYTKFYAQPTGNSTPLREALARVGRYFAGQTNNGINSGITDDPMQYYCQPNFAILSTDGLWNTGNETVGPVKINGSTLVGDQDSNPAITPRPLLDSIGTEVTTSTLTTELRQQVCTGSADTTFSTSGSGTNTPCGCTGNQKAVIQRNKDSTATSVSVNGGTPTTGTIVNNTFSVIVPCNATTTTQTTTPVTVQEDLRCVFTATVNFASGGSDACTCNSGRRVLIREKITGATRTVITEDGVVTSDTVAGGSRALTYSVNGTTFSSTKPTGNTCPSSGLSSVAPSYTGGTTTSSSTGATVSNAQITLSPNPKTTTFPPTSSSVNAGSPNTLADVAQYYYATDLRANGSLGAAVGSPATQLDVGTGDPNVPGSDMQRMTTFTIGLGVDGTLTYKSDYDTNPTGDFLALKNGSLNWPVPVADALTTVDDLWHAAVNGRGKYFSAQNPGAVAQGVSNALQGVAAVVGAAAAAATSNLEPVAGDNFAYIASYETVRWNGQLEARAIDLDTGVIGTTNIWSAQGQLDAITYSSRSIKRFNSGATNKLEDFTYANLTATEKLWFNSPYISTGVTGLTQWASLSAGNQTAAQGTNLVNFLRGDTSLEATVYRDRAHVLGDIVNAQPVFVKKAPFTYTDANYSIFANCVNQTDSSICTGIYTGTRPRPPTVYIAANDGMLHALNGDTGAERWSYVPNMVLPNLFRLADADYANRHMYSVDGTPTVGDIYDPGTGRWRTILVAGLNSGGRGFYALDVTDPLNPIGLWEFKVRATASCPSAVVLGTSTDDCDLGLSFGNPIISKLAPVAPATDGLWVVMVTSGYNNVSPGDGKGYLYVLDPITGVIQKKIQAANATQGINPGSNTTPLGLSKVTNFVSDTTVNNTTLRVYGGDLQGNLWRFNADAGTAYVVAQLKDPSNVAQPVTTRPELGEIASPGGPIEMVYVGTGEYLGASDLPSTQVQTIYGLKDATGGTTPATPLNARGGTVVAQTLTNTTDALGAPIRTVTSNPVNVASSGVNGWRIDLPNTGERVSIDPKLQLGTLVVGSNVPANTVCEPGGFSFLNYIDYETGSYVTGATTAGQKVPGSLLVGINIVRLPDGRTVVIATTADNLHPTLTPPFTTPNATGRRSGWRELSQ